MKVRVCWYIATAVIALMISLSVLTDVDPAVWRADQLSETLIPADLLPGSESDIPIRSVNVDSLSRGCRFTIKPPSRGLWVVSLSYILREKGTNTGSRSPSYHYERCRGEEEWQLRQESRSFLLTTETEVFVPAPFVGTSQSLQQVIVTVGRQGHIDRQTGAAKWPVCTVWRISCQE